MKQEFPTNCRFCPFPENCMDYDFIISEKFLINLNTKNKSDFEIKIKRKCLHKYFLCKNN